MPKLECVISPSFFLPIIIPYDHHFTETLTMERCLVQLDLRLYWQEMLPLCSKIVPRSIKTFKNSHSVSR